MKLRGNVSVILVGSLLWFWTILTATFKHMMFPMSMFGDSEEIVRADLCCPMNGCHSIESVANVGIPRTDG